jgi:hypothetical protein
MESGGDLLPSDVILLEPVRILRADIDCRQSFRCIEPPEGLLGDLPHVPDQRRG